MSVCVDVRPCCDGAKCRWGGGGPLKFHRFSKAKVLSLFSPVTASLLSWLRGSRRGAGLVEGEEQRHQLAFEGSTLTLSGCTAIPAATALRSTLTQYTGPVLSTFLPIRFSPLFAASSRKKQPVCYLSKFGRRKMIPFKRGGADIRQGRAASRCPS